jgi:hypothetical protein
MTLRSMAARWVVVAFLATLATLALSAVTLAQPAEAAPRVAALAVAGDDDGRGDDDGARGDDDGARGDDDAEGGVRDVPFGGVETGAGGTAASDRTQAGPGVPLLVAGGALLVGAVTALLRRVTGGVGS